MLRNHCKDRIRRILTTEGSSYSAALIRDPNPTSLESAASEGQPKEGDHGRRFPFWVETRPVAPGMSRALNHSGQCEQGGEGRGGDAGTKGQRGAGRGLSSCWA